ncbi:unnamed protein product [Lymnaea stagnalis]|uniref:TLC domain-containing protein n=1 Tax=Lymnaea stagnalis TaxID=6523 RepID=A0AAV2HLM0_LYMST
MKDTHWLTNAYVYFGMPYFLYDMWAMYSYHVRVNDHLYEKLDTFQRIKMFVYKNALMVAHHLLLPSILLPLVLIYREDKGDFFFGAFFMIEMVVPFISAREILLQLNMKHTRLYFYTSLSMIVMFFICRLAAFPYLYYKYAQYAGISFFDVPYVIPKKCNFSCLLILAPQVYWFILMIKGLHRAVYKIQQ